MSEMICLLVDDEPSVRTYLRAVLEEANFSCLEADSAPQALGILQKINGRIDFIITDLEMPGDMDGIDLAYSVKAAFPALPVIIVSGYADGEKLARLPKDIQFISKPFVYGAIVHAVRKAVESSKIGE